MADNLGCSVLSYTLQRQTKPVLQDLMIEVMPDVTKLPRGRNADLIHVILQWARVGSNHAHVCRALLAKLTKTYINFLIMAHVGRGHAGKTKREAIENFIAIDRPADENQAPPILVHVLNQSMIDSLDVDTIVFRKYVCGGFCQAINDRFFMRSALASDFGALAFNCEEYFGVNIIDQTAKGAAIHNQTNAVFCSTCNQTRQDMTKTRQILYDYIL